MIKKYAVFFLTGDHFPPAHNSNSIKSENRLPIKGWGNGDIKKSINK